MNQATSTAPTCPMTEQEDFLERLRDPDLAGLKRAGKEILETYPGRIVDFDVRQFPYSDDGNYSILLKAVDDVTLNGLEHGCMNIFCSHVPGIMIDASNQPTKCTTGTHYFKAFHASWRII